MRRTLLAIVLVCLCATLPVRAEVRWVSGSPGASAPMSRVELSRSLTTLAARTDKRHVVLQFDGPIEQAKRAELATRGARLLGYLGAYAWFAALEPGVDVQRLSAVAGLRRADGISVPQKLHPDLAQGITRPWSIVGAAPKSEKPEDAAAPSSNPTVAVYVMFHPDVDGPREARTILARHGAELRSTMRSINAVVAHLPLDRVPALADDDAVMYVEPPLPPLSEINDSNRTRVGADMAQDPPYGLDGSGVTVLVYDGGQVFEHGDLAGRLTIGATDTSAISDHATHVAGTIGGSGAGSAGQYRGMAPGVDFISFGFEQPGGLQQGFLYTDPGDLEADYGSAIADYGADISNNSIGTNTAPNGYPCEWEGDYGATGALIDAIVGGSLGDPFRVVWANGNERGSGRCGATYVTTAPPACAKNHITVGAMNSDDDSVTSFTSWGPCDDGRLKPDVAGPGCENGSDGGVTSTSSSGGYNVKCGTSMASPTVAGVGALLLQEFRRTFPGRPDFRNSTLKAILATTAEDIEAVGPDFRSGYGSVRAVPAIDLIGEERFLEAEVAQGEVYSFVIVVGPADTSLKVTLAWDDPSGTPNVDPVLVNDLDLRVIDGSSVTHFPWTLDPADPTTPAVRTVRDGVNNIEQVVIDNPAPGAYIVEVEGFNIAQGATQWFSAAASPSLINCADAGSLGADRNRVSCQANLGLRVIDCGLNTSDTLVETVDVAVVSTTEPGGETVTLTESAAESAAFFGGIALDTANAAGTLQVAEGDDIAVTYIDADDGAGGINVPVVRHVTVDCSPPAVTSVVVAEVKPRAATIDVALDEPGRVTLHVGTACGAPDVTAVSFPLAAQHSIAIKGLTDETTYFFTVEAGDEAGNVATDDNAGACYGFTTPMVPDFFTEQFTAGLDLVGQTLTWEPSGTNDVYALCGEPAAGLPTDPAGGTTLALADDQPDSFVLTGGATVALYGQSYDTVFVGPNGYLTFGSGDSAYSESFAAHFSLPRVAALFDDLNPSTGGTVSWKQTADRVAVTWQDVPEYSTSNANTFQIEMFFDGTIRITWVAIAVQDAIVGLSAGNGLDPDFLASDLSAGSGCGPRPPVVQNLSVMTGVDTPLQVTLVGLDDGLPGPLSYRLLRLPTYGTLTDDGTAQPIGSVPHDLQPGASSVTYTPAGGMQGYDSFDYAADDGGTAPDGGSSAAGLVGVTVGGESAVYEFLVDDTDPGWSTTGAWAFGPPTGGGSHNLDPTGGATGANVYGYNLSGDYTDNMTEESLTSGPLDLTGVLNTTLEFQRWLGIESSSYDHARVEISTDDTTWTTLWDHNGSALDPNAWTQQILDLSTIADNQPSVRLRWIMGTSDGSVTYPGWNLDDIRINAFTPGACSTPPAEIPGLRIDADATTLRWTPASYSGGTPPVYDLLRSTDGSNFASGATCLAADAAGTTAQDPQTPAAFEVYFYLVRAENNCGEGSIGTGRGAQSCLP